MDDHSAPRPDDPVDRGNDDDPVDRADGDGEQPPQRRRATGEDFVQRLEHRFVAALAHFDESAARRLPTAIREHIHLLVRQGGLDNGPDALRLAAITGVCQQAVAFSVFEADAFDTIGYRPLDTMDDETARLLVTGVQDLASLPDTEAATVMYARTTPALLDGLLSYRGAADHLAHHVGFSFLLSLSCGAGTTSPNRALAEALRAALPEPVLPILN